MSISLRLESLLDPEKLCVERTSPAQVWLAVFGFIFVGVLIAEVAIVIPHLLLGASVEGSFWLLTAITIIAAVIFLVEGSRFRKKSK
jgi:uncharacterized membrane protein